MFPDDSDLSAKRETALRAILDSVPAAFRVPMGAQFRAMVDAMNEQQLSQVVSDLAAAKVAANHGDMATIIDLARHWATDEQIHTYMPMAEQMLRTG